MKLSWKGIGIGLGAVIGVVLLAAVLFVAFFPKKLAAAEAERRIEAATGRQLTLGDNIDVSFWPALGFSVDQASLSNPAGFDSDKPFISANRIVFAVAVMPLLRGEVQVKRLIFEGAELRLTAKQDGTANWTFPTEETPENKNSLEDLRLDDVRLVDSFISFQGAEGDPPLTLEKVDASLALESIDQPATMNAAFDYRGERVTVESTIGSPRGVLEKGQTTLQANVEAASLKASLNGMFNAATGGLTGDVNASGDSLRKLMAWLGTPMGEGSGFGAYQFTAKMVHADTRTVFNDLGLTLDSINARGALTLINQENGRLKITGALSAPNIDLNTYLPAPPAQAAGAGVQVDSGWNTDRLDFSGLKALDADLNLAVTALKFQRMSFSNVQMGLRIANGAADARLTRIALYGGTGTARLIADGSQATPRIAVEIDARDIQAEPLLRDAIGFDKIVGRGRLQASLVGQGPSQAQVMRALRGTASFNFNDGQWKGVNLAAVARMVQSTVTGSQVGAGGGATDFAELSSSFAVSDGVAATDNLRLLNPYVRLEGKGLINIGAQTIDMRLEPRAVNNAQGQGGNAQVAGIGVPFRVFGPWSRVQYRVALEEVAQNQIRQILGRQEQGSPLSRLGEAIFGPQAAETTTTPAETPAQQPAQQGQQAQQPAQQQQQRPRRNPLEDIFRAVQNRNEDKQETTTTPAPAPSP